MKKTITGRVGRDPESVAYTSKKTGADSELAKFSIAVGEKPNTKWYNCAAFGRLVEPVLNKVSKGSEVEVVGEVKERDYTDKTGAARVSLDVTLDEFTVGGKTYSWKNQDEGDDVGF